MYAVKQVSALTGASEATLRVWERRYGVVHPTRSPSGYRLYDDDQVATLRAMVALVNSGVPASLAARTVRSTLGDGQVRRPSAEEAPETPDVVSAAASLDPVQLHLVLDAAFEGAAFDDVVDRWLPTELTNLGRAWADGRITVAQEHFASQGIARHLAGFFEEAQPDRTVSVVVGLPQGGRHELMLLAFATCLRRAGVNSVYLGGDVPIEDWVTVAAASGARAAVVGVHLAEDVPMAQQVVDSLSALRPPVAVRVGGSRRHEVTGAQQLDDRVSVAAATLARDLRAGAI